MSNQLVSRLTLHTRVMLAAFQTRAHEVDHITVATVTECTESVSIQRPGSIGDTVSMYTVFNARP